MENKALLISGILALFISSVMLIFNAIYFKNSTFFFIMIAILIASIIELLFTLFNFLYQYKKRKERNHN